MKVNIGLAAAFLFLAWHGFDEAAAGAALDSSPFASGDVLERPVGFQAKIIGGEEAGKDEFPFIASLRFPLDHRSRSRRGRHFCGGVLIAKNMVLSAAHCAKKDRSPDIHIGRHMRTKDNGDGVEIFKTKEVREHSKFRRIMGDIYDYDIAIFVLDGDSTINPIGFRKDEKCFAEGSRCALGTVIGWGLTDYNDETSESEVLLKVNVPLTPRPLCNDRMPSSLTSRGGVTESMVCAGERDKDACLNDSGGPLLVGRSVAGIVSFGFGCGGDVPGVYASVAAVKDWIKQQMDEIEGKVPPKPPPPPPPVRFCRFFHGKFFPPGCNLGK